MRAFDYYKELKKLLILEIVQMVSGIHEHKCKFVLNKCKTFDTII